MDAMAQGIVEMVDDDYIAHRISQVRALGQRLIGGGVPIVLPIGGHAIFLDAKAFSPHIPQDEFPAQALAAARGRVSDKRLSRVGFRRDPSPSTWRSGAGPPRSAERSGSSTNRRPPALIGLLPCGPAIRPVARNRAP